MFCKNVARHLLQSLPELLDGARKLREHLTTRSGKGAYDTPKCMTTQLV